MRPAMFMCFPVLCDPKNVVNKYGEAEHYKSKKSMENERGWEGSKKQKNIAFIRRSLLLLSHLIMRTSDKRLLQDLIA